MNGRGLNGSTHFDLSRNYGCPATMTVVTFRTKGAIIRARRFWRADMPETGKIEMYTLEPTNTYSSGHNPADTTFATEDFLRYANTENPSRDEAIAIKLIQNEITHSVTLIPADTAERYAMIELA